MPVFTHQSQSVPNHDELVNAIVAELNGSAPGTSEPQIYENEIHQTQTLHVLVIWHRWSGVPASSRGPIIYDAYERFDPARMHRIKFAFGFTYNEAIAGGYLPYKVEGVIRGSDTIDREAVRQEFLALGARQTTSGMELRFPYRALAEQAIHALETKFGQGYFALVQEVGSVGQWAKS
jgi:hypothetical protein